MNTDYTSVTAEQVGRQHLGASVFLRIPQNDIEVGITGTIQQVTHSQSHVTLVVAEVDGTTEAWEMSLDQVVNVQ